MDKSLRSSDDEVDFSLKKNITNGTISLDEDESEENESRDLENTTNSRNNEADDESEEEDDDDVEEIESDDEDKPSGAECLSRCKQFAEITGTDTALAMFYLQDTKWDLEKGLNAFYQSTQQNDRAGNACAPGSGGGGGKGTRKVVACFDVNQLNEDERKLSEANRASKKSRREEEEELAEQTVASAKLAECSEEGAEKSAKDYFKILSWNIDGLDKSSVEARALGVANKILNEKPDIVFLQEVIEENERVLKSKLKDFYVFSSGNISLIGSENGEHQQHRQSSVNNSDFYYTLILTKKTTCSIKVKLLYKNKVSVSAMTAHLESTTEFSKQRVEQLKLCFKYMLDQSENSFVFFGGDLNLRDSELKSIGGLPKGVHDLWEATGSRKECLYTWDCLRNSNLTMNTKFKPRCRFDRLYFRQPTTTRENQMTDASLESYVLTPIYFELEGLEKLKSCGRFCSDHWAIQSYCRLEANNFA